MCYHTRKQFLGSQFKQALNLSFLPLLTIKSLCYVLFRDQTTVLQILSNQRTVSDCNSYLSLCYWSESPRGTETTQATAIALGCQPTEHRILLLKTRQSLVTRHREINLELMIFLLILDTECCNTGLQGEIDTLVYQ